MLIIFLVVDCRQVTKNKTEVISTATIFVVTYDEVTTIDNRTWILMHVYVVIEWERFHILVALQYV